MAKKIPVIISFEALDNVSAPLRKLNKKLEETQAPIKRFSNQLSRFGKASGITQLSNSVKNVGEGLMGVGNAAFTTALKLGGMATAGVIAFDKLVGGAIESNSKLAEIAERTGVSVEALQKWRFVAEQTGATTEDLDSAIVKFSKNLAQARLGKGPLVELLDQDSINQLTKLKDPEKAFTSFVDSMAQIPNEGDKILLLTTAFGKSADALVNMTQLSKAERQALMAQREAMGLLNQEQANRFRIVGDQMKALAIRFDVLKSKIALALLPVVQDVFGRMDAFIVQNQDKIVAFAQQFTEKLIPALEKIIPIVADMAVKFADWVAVGDNLQLLLGGIALIAAGPLISSIINLGGALITLTTKALIPLLAWLSPILIPLGIMAIKLAAIAGAAYVAYRGIFALGQAVGILDKNKEALSLGDIGGAVKNFVSNNVLGGNEQSLLAPPAATGLATAPKQDPRTMMSESRVVVDFNNMPKGARVRTEAKQDSNLEVGVGYALGGSN